MAAYPSSSIRFSKAELAFVFVAALVSLNVYHALREPPPVPTYDAIGYIRLALGLSEHGVLGYYLGPDRPPPSEKLSPLYPSLLSVVLNVDAETKKGFICLATSPPEERTGCSVKFETVIFVQHLMMAAFLLSVWMIAFVMARSRVMGWLALALALASGVPNHFANLFLTESLILPLFGFFTLLLLLTLYRQEQFRWPLLTGLVLGLMAITRPTYEYLFFMIVVPALAYFVVTIPCKVRWVALGVFSAGYLLMTVPVTQFGPKQEIAHTGTGYGARALAHRIGYNQMSWPVIGVGFLYWIPDFGDGLAESLFPEQFDKLRVSDNYFLAGVEAVKEADAKGEPLTVAGQLKDVVTGEPIKHAAVSAVLAWRGMLVSKNWGFLGWIAAAFLLWRAARKLKYDEILLFLPVLAMIAFHATVSVSVPRYNIIVVPALSYAMAVWLFLGLNKMPVVSRLIGVNDQQAPTVTATQSLMDGLADARTNESYAQLRQMQGDGKAHINGYRSHEYFRKEQAHILNLIGTPPSPILDIGCGSGLLLQPLTGTNTSVVGMDFNESACADAKENDLLAVRGNAFKAPFKEEAFPLAIATQFLNQQSEQNVKNLLQQAEHMLRDDGKLILVWRNGNALIHRIAHAVFMTIDRLRNAPQFPYVNHSIKDVKSWASDAGLELETEQAVLAVAGLTFDQPEGIASKTLGASYVAVFKKPGKQQAA